MIRPLIFCKNQCCLISCLNNSVILQSVLKKIWIESKIVVMQISVDIEALSQQIYMDSAFLDVLKSETNKVLVGQEKMLDSLLIGLLTN